MIYLPPALADNTNLGATPIVAKYIVMLILTESQTLSMIKLFLATSKIIKNRPCKAKPVVS